LPTEEDELKNDIAHDIFGRERHRTYRDDMGGVGSFLKENRTLHITGYQRGKVNEEVLLRHFGEFGDIENIRIVHDKSMAFIRYRLRGAAEFAKEAMIDQSLDNNEVLSVRWANEDPNPKAKQDEESKRKIQLARIVAAKRLQREPVYQYDPQVTGTTTPALDHFPSDQYSENAYPNTDYQYNQDSTASNYPNSSEMVTNWLTSFEMGQYAPALLSGGYMDFQSLSQLDEIGLDAVGITNPDHRASLLNAAAYLTQYLAQQQDTTTSYTYANPEYTGSQTQFGDGSNHPS